MEFQSLSFLLFSFAAFILYRIAPLKTKATAHLLFGMGFVYSFSDLFRLSFLVVLTSLIFYLGNSYLKTKRRELIYIGWFLILTTFILYKLNLETLRIHPFFSLIGISYICLKLYHFLSDIKNGALKEITWLHFMGFLFFFPSFLAGPITRYNEFAVCYQQNSRSDSKETLISLMQILSGIFKKFVLSAWLFPFSIISIDLNAASQSQLFFSMMAYSFYIYLDFSGYTDMARGLGKLLGVSLPPNFRYPYLRRNLIEFWTHWHISLSQWLRDYIYLPFSLFLARSKFPFKKQGFIIANMLTMSLCGLWHGLTWNFMIWGLYHGLGLSIVRGYDLFLKENQKYPVMQVWAKVHHRLISPLFSCFINFLFVSFGWLFFALPAKEAATVFKWILWGKN